MRITLLIALLLGHSFVNAKIPGEYAPMIVEAPFSFSERAFDLTSAIARARHEAKPLFIYLGAADCPPCQSYSIFLVKNREQLRDSFDQVIVVDVRTWLKGPALIFKVDDKRHSFAEFKALVGDRNKTLTYPYFWLLTPDLKQVKQLPQGSANYLSVEKHAELLRLQ
jgi:hypothetical protein